MQSVALISSIAESFPNFRRPLIRELRCRGVHVYALAPDYNESSYKAMIELGAKPVRYSLQRTGVNPFRDLADMIRLRNCLKELEVDVVVTSFIKPNIYGTLAAWLARIPHRVCMIEGAGHVFITCGEKERLMKRTMRLAVQKLYCLGFSKANHVFVLNQDDEELFVRRGMVDAAKISRIPGVGIDLEEFYVRPLQMNPVTFLFLGRLLQAKGIREFIGAARQVKQEWPDVRFVVLGDVDDNPSSLSRPQVKEWVREGLIEWPGYVDDVRPWISQASVFVLPSYREGLPRSTMEAMASGRPVITTDVPGCRETVVDERNGFLIPAREIAPLASAMGRFIENPSLIESMGRESRRIAEERFDVERINQVIIDALFGDMRNHKGASSPPT